jgi:hypothetical protein
MKRWLAIGAIVLAACEPGTAPPPPITLPPLPPVAPVSQCKEVFPSGYTRPIQTNHQWIIYSSLPGQRVIRWLLRTCDKWIQGPYDPAHPELWCAYRPDLGDRYYSERDGFVATPPQACPQGV